MAGLWISLTLAVPPSDTRDLLIAFLWECGATGFIEEDTSFTAYIPDNIWNEQAAATFGGYCDGLRSGGKTVPEPAIERVEEQNWNREWEKTIAPVRITDRIVIRPSWDTSLNSDGMITITIDPKMSFGTGYHETTRLMLRLLDKTVRRGDRVLDVGTGTGVLAIASIKLGASLAIGVDNDEWSYENALENVGANDIASGIVIRKGSIGTVPENGFDVVLANIHFSVIVEMLEELVEHLSPDGHLLLSGVLDADEEQLRGRLTAAGCSVAEVLYENEWIAVSALKGMQ